LKSKVLHHKETPMPWIIDIDHIAEADAKPGTLRNAVGLAGPSGYTGDGSELTEKFRLLDDDGIVYYEGRSGDSSDFGPLDDFGMPNAGAARIQYWVAGKGWAEL
jgi:hypothetical protein